MRRGCPHEGLENKSLCNTGSKHVRFVLPFPVLLGFLYFSFCVVFFFFPVRTALIAIIGFMPTKGEGAIGSLDYTPEERKALAKK